MEDTDNAHIPKVSTTTWFKPIPESERPATPEPEWTIPPNDFPEPEHNWANAYATTFKVPEENKLQRKTYDIGSFIKWFCRRTGKKKLSKLIRRDQHSSLVKAYNKNSVFLNIRMEECHKLLTNKVDLSNPEGHQILRNMYEPLPLGGPPGQPTITSKKTIRSSLSQEQLSTETEMIKKLDDAKELHNISDGTLTKSMEMLDQMVFKDFILRVIRAWRLKWQRMRREEAKDFQHSNREKTTDHKDLIEV
ncbi:hypothetical protein Tco_0915389 [Tanacetum coccineum]